MQSIAAVARPRPHVERARRRYGDVFTTRYVGFGPLVVVADPVLVKQVFTEDAGVLHVGGRQNPLEPVLGAHSLLVIDEDHHLGQRKLLLPPFHGRRMLAYEGLIAEIAAEEIDRWPRGRAFATWPSFQRITLRAILRAVFGAEGAEVAELERVLPRFVNMGGRMAVFGRPLQHDLGPLSPWGRFLRARADVDRRLDALIARARERPGEDVLSLLAHSGMEDAAIRDQLITLLAAGHETTAGQLAWAVERARRHPEALERLHEPAYRAAFIREVQRQRPVIAFAARTTVGEYQLGDHLLPPETRVGLAAALTHFDPRLFEAPDEFNPQRFAHAKADTYAWIPFGGGVRRCIGAAFAHMEMDVVLRTLLERVSLATAAGEPGEGWRFHGVIHVPSAGGRAVLA